jgi:hypothetical protein
MCNQGTNNEQPLNSYQTKVLRLSELQTPALFELQDSPWNRSALNLGRRHRWRRSCQLVEATLTDLCSDGAEHEPVVETEELVTEFWGDSQKTIKVTITCARCGEACRPRYEDERDESCVD